MNSREMKQGYLFLAAAMMTLVAASAFGQAAGPPYTAAGWTSTGDGLIIRTTDTTPNVKVGIGVNPDAALTLKGAETFRYNPHPTVRLLDLDFNENWAAVAARNGAAFRMDLRDGQPTFSWRIRAANEPIPGATQTVRMLMTATGLLAIGTDPAIVNASDKLEVFGDALFTGTVTGGNIQAKYQDVAEWVPADEQIPAATVVVLDPERVNHVVPSSIAYDSKVAGVVSARPGIVLGEASDSKVKVATTGRVKVRVDASAAPVKIGDLLVTSDKPGVAMKSQPVEVAGIKMHRPGTVIGKALEPLPSGEGEILVLLSLQ